MRYSKEYRVWYYTPLPIPGVNLTRDDIARRCGDVTPRQKQKVIEFCNNKGIEDIRELTRYQPEDIEKEKNFGERTKIAMSRLLNGLCPEKLKGDAKEWIPENDSPWHEDPEVVREQESKLGRAPVRRSLVTSRLRGTVATPARRGGANHRPTARKR